MGIGDNISKAAENAFEDMGGLSKPTDDGHVPDPGAPDEEIKVHSSISEGSNATDAPPEQGANSGDASRPAGTSGDAGTKGNIVSDENGADDSAGDPGRDNESADGVEAIPRDVPGPAGLPNQGSGEATR